MREFVVCHLQAASPIPLCPFLLHFACSTRVQLLWNCLANCQQLLSVCRCARLLSNCRLPRCVCVCDESDIWLLDAANRGAHHHRSNYSNSIQKCVAYFAAHSINKMLVSPRQHLHAPRKVCSSKWMLTKLPTCPAPPLVGGSAAPAATWARAQNASTFNFWLIQIMWFDLFHYLLVSRTAAWVCVCVWCVCVCI